MKCAECGIEFDGRSSLKAGGHDAKFCCVAHKNTYRNRHLKRGAVAIPLLLAWRGAKSKRGDATGAYAFGELCRLADEWNAEDRAAGREAGYDYIRTGKLRDGWSATDLPSINNKTRRAA